MYNFDEIVDRRNTNSVKWDEDKDALPMWIADMDFLTYPKIQEAIIKRANHGVYGYSSEPEELYEAVIGFWNRMHHFQIMPEWMFFSTGVVASISACVRKFSTPNENVLVLEPCYNIFFNSIINNGRRIVSSDLVYENGSYHIDFNDFKKKCSDPQTSMMILCNPHNPTGNLWSKEELEKIGKICYENHVLVISDEIHCDIVSPGYEYIPFASVNEINKMNSITCIAPSKVFNVAGLQGSICFSANEALRHRAWREVNTSECGEGNAFTYQAMIAGFSTGDEWVKELNQYIYENKIAFKNALKDTKLKIVESNATYLAWVDVSAYTSDSKKLQEHLKKNAKLFVSPGDSYGGNGHLFLRINLATQRVNVLEGARRLIEGLKTFKD